MTQEQRIKEFVDKWVGKHGFAGIFHNYRKDCIQDLTNLLDNWISVEDELPKDFVSVLVFTDELIYIAYYSYFKKEWIRDHRFQVGLGNEFLYVTHWQPLSQPPKE